MTAAALAPPITTTATPTIRDRVVAPPLSASLRVRLVEAGTLQWRVVADDGRVLGHLKQEAVGGATRYRARRFHTASRAFRDVGDFWSADDAARALVFSR